MRQNKQNPHKGETARPILLVALSQGYGGADVRVFDMAHAFHGHATYAVATLDQSPLHKRLEAAGLSTRPLPYSRSDPRLLWHLYRLIKEEGFTVVDAHNPQSQFWGLAAARLAKVPRLVSTVHHAYGLVTPLRFLDRLYEKVLHLNIRWGSQFVTVSQAIHDYLLQIGVPPADLSLINNAINTDVPATDSSDFLWREELAWGEETVVIVVVGRLEIVKGHTFLLEAMQLALRQWPQLRCVVVGEGRMRTTLEEQIETLGLNAHVQLMGFRQDVDVFLRSSDIFCLSSLSEGLPYALLEASTYKLPLVVTAVGGMAELLTDGQNARLVPPSDPAALAAAFGSLVDHPEEKVRLGKAAHTLIKERFSPAVMMAETMMIYDR